MKTRRQIWIEGYRLRPYLQHSSEQEIAERLRYIIENMTTMTPSGKITALPPEPRGKFWYELFEHALEEYRRRGIEPPPGFLKGAQVPNPAQPVSSAALKAVSEARLAPDGTSLVKLGRRQHISNFYERSELRIAPASAYADPSLNSAIRDDELALSAFGQQSEVVIPAFDEAGALKFATKPRGNLTYTSRERTNYYVQCMATKLDARLFADFGYDACLIIHDHEEFERRLVKAVESHLPGWLGGAGPVSYLDPFNCKRDDMDVFIGKHLKYSYQHEYRFFWLPRPPSAIQSLTAFNVELGSMREISSMIVLDPDSPASG